jgi:hypothetical protein
MSSALFIGSTCALDASAAPHLMAWSYMDPIIAVASKVQSDKAADQHQIAFCTNEVSDRTYIICTLHTMISYD